MDLTNEPAASAPTSGDAGLPSSGNDAAATRSDGLESAISAALDGAEKTSAGDMRPGEDVSSDRRESSEPSDNAVQQDNANALKAPQHWPDDRKETFDRLPDEAKATVMAFVKDFQSGFTRKTQELGDQAKYAQAVRGLFDDSERQQLAKAGVHEVQLMGNLVNIHRFSQKDPVGYIKWAMQELKVDPATLVPAAKPADDPKEPSNSDLDDILMDPAVKTLAEQVKSLQEHIENDRRSKEQQLESVQAQRAQELNSTVESFRASQDDTGNLLYPHFDTVRGHMAALMRTDPNLAKLEDGPAKMHYAYHLAVRAHSELSHTAIEDIASRRMAEQKQKDDAERAKRAAGPRPGIGAPVAASQRKSSLDDALNAALSQFGG